jgi:hypothetical protein
MILDLNLFLAHATQVQKLDHLLSTQKNVFNYIFIYSLSLDKQNQTLGN